MGKFFSIDGGFFRFMTKVADFILLDLLVIIFSIPIVTIGPALSALFYVALKEVRDEEGYVWKSFWKAFKQNFKQGFLLELIVGVAIVVIYFDFLVSYNWAMSNGSFLTSALTFALFGLGLVVLAALVYVFPLQAKFDNKVFNTLKNSFVLSMKHLPQTIIMMIGTYGLIYYTVRYPLFVIFTIGLIAYIDSFIFVRIFDIYIPKEKDEFDEDITDENDSENK